MGGLGGRSPPNREAGGRLGMGGVGGRSPPTEKCLDFFLTLMKLAKCNKVVRAWSRKKMRKD